MCALRGYEKAEWAPRNGPLGAAYPFPGGRQLSFALPVKVGFQGLLAVFSRRLQGTTGCQPTSLLKNATTHNSFPISYSITLVRKKRRSRFSVQTCGIG